jgi:hypothetical protein
MKKLLIVGGVLAGLGLIGVLVLTLFLGNIVTAGVNRFAPQITQTSVTLASATISPLNGSGTLNNLVVGNPKGWSDASLCSLGKVHLDVAPFSILGDHVVINEIIIEAPEFNYETHVISSNVGDLLKNLEQISGSKDAPKATTKSGKLIKFEVKKFRLENGWVRVGVGPAALKLPMPPIAIDDLGTSEGGITPDQLTFAVMRRIAPSVIAATTAAAGKLIPTAGAAATGALKSLFGGKK